MENSKTKVLFIITKGNFGGAQRYVYDLATSLPKENFECVVACGEGTTLKEKLRESGIRVIELTSSQRDIDVTKEIRTFFDLVKLIKAELPNVIHLNSSKVGALGALAVKYCSLLYRIKSKSVFTAHAWAFNESRGLIQKIMIFAIHWFTILLTHRTIAVSKKIQTDIDWMPFINNKIKVIYNGVKNFKTITKKEALKELVAEEEHTAKKIVIVSLSELTNNKGLDIAIESLNQLSEKEKICYRILGQGEEKQNLQNMIDKFGLSNQVKLLGFVPDAKRLLSGADIFLLPSRTEAFPYVILEAGAVGLPIISTCVGGIPEVITDMENGILVYPKNPREIAEAISYLINHKEKRKDFGIEIKKTITENFTFEKMLSETISIYS